MAFIDSGETEKYYMVLQQSDYPVQIIIVLFPCFWLYGQAARGFLFCNRGLPESALMLVVKHIVVLYNDIHRFY